MARQKSSAKVPDEVISYGPFQISRFGRHIVWESHWPEGTFVEAQKIQVEQFPRVVSHIDGLVSAIAALVRVLPPKLLLQRAWWEMGWRHTKIATEAEITFEDGVLVRMIDYIQSVIASVKPADDSRQDVTDEEWESLRAKVAELFETLNTPYQICRTAKNRADSSDFDLNVEEFQYRAQAYWCNIRGSRYQVHEPAYLSDMFLPHTAVLKELFGITGEEFVSEITKIWHVLSFGIGEVAESLVNFQKDLKAAVEKKRSAAPASATSDLASLITEVVTENNWQERRESLSGRFVGMDLFDLQKTTAFPEKLLTELSWFPGEEEEFFAEGEFRGWPLRIWPIFKRPFIRLEGRYYCFDLYSLFDHIYRIMQRIIVRLKPDYAQTWNQIQQGVSEELPLRYLERILPGAKILHSVFYRGLTDSGIIDWCETDGLLSYDDCLFIIEARGGAFTYTPPATDFPAYVASLKNLVLKPVTQGRRFLNYLNSAETVPLFNENHDQIGEARRRDFRQITICTVTLDPFTEIAAQVQHLQKIGFNVGSDPVWSISLDDLRVYADIFENPLVFLHYVQQRMRAFRSQIIQSDDELDHLGLYLKHNDYSTYAEELRGRSGARLTFTGYRSAIDHFFTERMLDANFPCPLRQSIPSRISQIVEFLSRSTLPGRARIASYLLDLDGDGRARISRNIDEELARQPTQKRAKPISTHAGANLTVFCWTDSWAPRKASLALEHARTVLLSTNDRRRLLLELSYSDGGDLKHVAWKWIELNTIPPTELPRLRTQADQLREVRLLRSKIENGKIGRNDPCPCGSGKKYKRCCANR
jgi:hypothetical protein